MKQTYAEDCNYWKSSTIAPDAWIDKAAREIVAVGGKVDKEAFGVDNGRAAFLLGFQIGDDRYIARWPVLESRTRSERAARIQAATMLYHDVKHRCVQAKVFGARHAFFQWLALPDGRTAAQLAAPEVMTLFPRLLTGGGDDQAT